MTALKFPSDRLRPAVVVFAGLKEALEKTQSSSSDIGYFSHGTTLAVNTILEYNGARTALLVTKGLRDILYIGRHRLARHLQLLHGYAATAGAPRPCDRSRGARPWRTAPSPCR